MHLIRNQIYVQPSTGSLRITVHHCRHITSPKNTAPTVVELYSNAGVDAEAAGDRGEEAGRGEAGRGEEGKAEARGPTGGKEEETLETSIIVSWT